MENKLNKEQIAYVSQWIKARGVTYYDVKMEMVDHLVLEIEELMDSDKLQFYAAKKKAFSIYKRFHFMNIEEEKEKLLQKQSWKEFKRELKGFFTLPKVVITLLIFMCIYTILSFSENEYLDVIFTISGVLVFVVLFVRNWLFLGKRRYLQLLKYNGFMTVLSQLLFYVPQIIYSEYLSIGVVSSVLTLLVLSVLITVELYSTELKKLKAQIV